MTNSLRKETNINNVNINSPADGTDNKKDVEKNIEMGVPIATPESTTSSDDDNKLEDEVEI